MATSNINQNLECPPLNVIDAQFDLEILLRHRELQKVKEELKKSELYLNTLKHCILEPPSNSHRTSTLNTNTCNESLGVTSLTPTRHSTRKIYSTRDNDYFYYDPCKDLYSRRNDGTFDESLIPPGHPARSRVITRPPSLRTILSQSNLSATELNDSNEVSLVRKSPSNNAIMSYSDNSPFLSCTMPDNIPDNITKISENRAMLGSPDGTDSVYSSDVDEGDTGTTTTDIDSSPTSCPNTMILDNNQSVIRSPEELEKNDQLSKESITNLSEIHQEDNVETTKIKTNVSTMNLSNGNGVDSEPNDEMITSSVSMPTSTPNTDSMSTSTPNTVVRERIVIGNVSKWIAPEKRDLSLRKYTHKWMVYVTGPPHDLNVTPFIRMVRFFLHPSYRPLDVVDVTEPPFQLTRFGWGEFPIRLDNTHNGKQQLGNERAFDLELDRNTQFIEPKPEGPINHTINIVQEISQQDISDINNVSIETETEATKELLQKRKSNDRIDPETMSSLDPLLNEAVKNYPLITPLSIRSSTLPYATAKSSRAFLNWNVERRKGTVNTVISFIIITDKTWHEINTSTSKSGIVPTPAYKCKRRPHFLETKKTKLCSLTLVQDFLDENYQDKNGKGNEINDENNLNNNGITISNKTLTVEAGIDWIWEVVDQLKLDGIVATKLIKIDGKIDVENGDMNVAIQQRLETGNLIFLLDDPFTPEINWFSSSALDSRYNSYRQRIKKILVPYHLHQAIQANLNTFDFLNGEGLASDKKRIQE
ncbi:15789_t:CDS:10 [Racocetra fulgida]|uniref:15789_t:CDS:1 n=1 Tax=Racocetra fulgida TaxID=60492 RepID=A0A9N8YX80_9GLOM|nr:15789_t:CDS:10 [Racocetra fulgida]